MLNADSRFLLKNHIHLIPEVVVALIDVILKELQRGEPQRHQ